MVFKENRCNLSCQKGVYHLCDVYLFIYLNVYLSFCLSVWLSIYLSFCLYVILSVYLSIYLTFCVCIYPSIHPSFLPSIYLPTCLSTYLSVYLPIYLSVYLSIHPSFLPSFLPSIYLPTYLSVYLSIHPSIHLSIYLSVYLSIHLSIYLPICLSIRFPVTDSWSLFAKFAHLLHQLLTSSVSSLFPLPFPTLLLRIIIIFLLVTMSLLTYVVCDVTLRRCFENCSAATQRHIPHFVFCSASMTAGLFTEMINIFPLFTKLCGITGQDIAGLIITLLCLSWLCPVRN